MELRGMSEQLRRRRSNANSARRNYLTHRSIGRYRRPERRKSPTSLNTLHVHFRLQTKQKKFGFTVGVICSFKDVADFMFPERPIGE